MIDMNNQLQPVSSDSHELANKFHFRKLVQRRPIQRKVKQLPTASSSSALNISHSSKRELNFLQLPNINQVIRSMAEQDQLFVYRLPIRRFSAVFFIRLHLLTHLMFIKRKFRLYDETLFIAAYVFDQYIIFYLPNLRHLEGIKHRCKEKLLSEKFKNIKEYSVLKKVALSAILLASKYQEISPIKLSEISEGLLTQEEFSIIEAELLFRVGFRILPSSYTSYIHLIIQKALPSGIWIDKIRRLVLMALLGNYLSHGKPLHIISGLALLFVYNDLPESLSSLRRFFLEFDIDESLCVDACTRLSFDFKDFYECFDEYDIGKCIKLAITEDDHSRSKSFKQN